MWKFVRVITFEANTTPFLNTKIPRKYWKYSATSDFEGLSFGLRENILLNAWREGCRHIFTNDWAPILEILMFIFEQ